MEIASCFGCFQNGVSQEDPSEAFFYDSSVDMKQFVTIEKTAINHSLSGQTL